MAGTNEYLDEAYNTLLQLSADDEKRLEYEAREKAIRDYNSQMNSAERHGIAIGKEEGIAIGQKQGIAITKRIFNLSAQGKPVEEIASLCGVTVEKVLEILE